MLRLDSFPDCLPKGFLLKHQDNDINYTKCRHITLGRGTVCASKQMLLLVELLPCEGFIGVFVVARGLETDLSF